VPGGRRPTYPTTTNRKRIPPNEQPDDRPSAPTTLSVEDASTIAPCTLRFVSGERDRIENEPEEPLLSTEITTNADDSVTIAVKGEIDASTSDDFGAALRQALPAGILRVDLSGVSFMDSSGLNALVTARHECEARQARLVVVDDNPNIRHLFELAGLNGLFEREPPTP